MASDTDTRKIAVETDTALSAQYEELAWRRSRRVGAYNRLHQAVGDRKFNRNRRYGWEFSDETVYTLAEQKIDRGEDESGKIGQAMDYLVEIERDIDLVNERIAELERIHDEYRWNRYFLVTNNNGHVHRNMGCTTCFPTTEYAWLVELADCDEAEMITEFGEKACTVCFPDAPANPQFHGPGRRDAEAQAARQAEKDARDAVKNAKRLAADEVFRTRYNRDRVETVAACKDVIRKATDTAEELKVIVTPAFAKIWIGDSDQLARYVGNVTDNLSRQELDAQQAKSVLLAREARHEGHGMTQAAIDKMIASKRKASAKAWARA